MKDRLGPRPLDTDKRPRQSESETDSETRGRRKTRRNSEGSHDMEHDDEIVINTQQHEEFEEGSEHDSDGYQSDRTEGASDRGDNNDDEDDNTGDNPSYRKVAKPPGEWRVIVTAKDGDTVTLDREFFNFLKQAKIETLEMFDTYKEYLKHCITGPSSSDEEE